MFYDLSVCVKETYSSDFTSLSISNCFELFWLIVYTELMRGGGEVDFTRRQCIWDVLNTDALTVDVLNIC